MRVRKDRKKLKIAGLVILALLMLLASHMAYSPYNLLPSGFRWALYPVAEGREESPLAPGNMALCDKNAAGVPGALVALTTVARDGGGDQTVCWFGRVVSRENGLSAIRLNMDGEYAQVNAYYPQRVIYRINGLGALVLFLHANRLAVWLICLGLTLGYVIYRLVTMPRRRMERTREEYIRLFDEYGRQFDEEEEF